MAGGKYVCVQSRNVLWLGIASCPQRRQEIPRTPQGHQALGVCFVLSGLELCGHACRSHQEIKAQPVRNSSCSIFSSKSTFSAVLSTLFRDNTQRGNSESFMVFHLRFTDQITGSMLAYH